MQHYAIAVRMLSLSIAVFTASGCSFFGPRMQTITIASEPRGAKISINGATVGKAPMQTQVHRGEDVLITADLEGYETGFRTTHRSLSTVGLLDTFGAFLLFVPLIGLLSPAAWAHEPTAYAIILDPKEQVESPPQAEDDAAVQ